MVVAVSAVIDNRQLPDLEVLRAHPRTTGRTSPWLLLGPGEATHRGAG